MMIKKEAHKLIDLMHEIYIREAIERGLADRNAGRTKDVQKIREKYGLPA